LCNALALKTAKTAGEVRSRRCLLRGAMATPKFPSQFAPGFCPGFLSRVSSDKKSEHRNASMLAWILGPEFWTVRGDDQKLR
jgi:hypothetical protein